MSDYPADTPVMTQPWCPFCEPGRNPVAEMLELRWCSTHQPPTTGEVDHVVNAQSYLTGSAEAGGEDNRAWCALFHRRPA